MRDITYFVVTLNNDAAVEKYISQMQEYATYFYVHSSLRAWMHLMDLFVLRLSLFIPLRYKNYNNVILL